MSDQQTGGFSSAELEILLERAARRGAAQALQQVGLHDEHAGKDINDLRDLIDGWRSVRRTVISTITKWVTLGILGAIALGAWHWGNDK
jgi:hypothetical protein